MDGFDRETNDASLFETEAYLREQVPRATGLELDRVWHRATNAGASRGRSTKRSGFMRSRIAVTFMLVLGFLISGSGAAVAVSGISGAGSAGEQQYAQEQVGGEQDVLGESASGNQGSVEGSDNPAQAARQVAVTGGDDGLPFSGFAAIPLLLVGAGLTAAGLILRRPRAQKIG